MQADTNQRLSQRHIPRHTLLAVSAWPNSELGVVRDIGLGGFSLECTCGDFRPGMEMVFDIFASGHPDNILLAKMPCRLVYDHHRQDILPLGLISPLKVYGFHFTGLSPEQYADLQAFLEREALAPGRGRPASQGNSSFNC